MNRSSNPLPSSPAGSVRLWQISLFAVMGIMIGLGTFTFNYAEGLSYFSTDPAACVNCHIMREQFDGWNHSSHKNVAACNDCHAPHDPVGKLVIKGINGWNHSLAFTTGNFPDPIRIKGMNAKVAQDNCVYCHADLVSQIHQEEPDKQETCIACHGNVGHGK
ncbi:MAG: cytochrome c nitrite reductase small subunit [Caldilineaceae bacterium]|nr:cytochrome c nitrite reductase small subunit [Caldilineaceae bacterium]MBP8105964.1 cytochrome c nitrite reductase small subunit [Caldilineaceae bacterium]MBP8124904.1 cytochrome c nitrite reductase small subunit [Caldilineaceae bacterium]MBP9071884.1 cytochrome c nitrite reductase small subunit [Caldilineaceae bacterium]